MSSGSTPAPTFTSLASFNGTDGYQVDDSLIADASGDLFGTTYGGGSGYNAASEFYGYGTVFEIVKTATGYSAPVTIVSFNQTNGAYPEGNLMADPAGNLFGTTAGGLINGTGHNALGTVFEIPKTIAGYGSLITLASFNGAYPGPGLSTAGLIEDASGDLFGTTSEGGVHGYGTAFEIPYTSAGYGAPIILAAFDGTNGARPNAGLIADASGDLFGTTSGQNPVDGTVFELARTATGYSAPIVLASFNDAAKSANGAYLYGGLTADAAGNLFGTTTAGGVNGYGTVFEIAKTAGGYGAPTTLASFDYYTTGASPRGNLVIDAAGDIFGATQTAGNIGGGSIGDGTVFKLVKTATGYSAPVILTTFNSTNGAFPYGGLIADASGNLFGTTQVGGAIKDSNGQTFGTVFEISNSGFVVSKPVVPAKPTLTLTGITANAVPTITGTADAGDTVTLSDGTTVIGTTTADASTGAFSFTGLSALAVGEHILTATAATDGSQTSAASNPLVVEVGTAATIVGELDALEAKAGLAAIVLTDTHVLTVASVAAEQHLISSDAAALATIQGPYYFAVATTTPTSTATSYYNSSGVLLTTSTVKSDGSTTLDTFAPSGTLIREGVTYADKSQDIEKYGITGQSYATEHDIYNAAGVLTLQNRNHADGTHASTYVLNTDGSSELDTFNATGILTRQGVTHADKSQDIYKYSGSSPNAVTEHDVLNAQGKQTLVDQTQADGSHKEYVSGAGQTLTSNTGVSDIFNNASTGSTTFVFNPSFGQDLISGFHAGAGSDHDTIHINAPALHQFSDLVALMSSSGPGGQDTLIKIDPNDTILLKHVTISSLDTKDFSFNQTS